MKNSLINRSIANDPAKIVFQFPFGKKAFFLLSSPKRRHDTYNIHTYIYIFQCCTIECDKECECECKWNGRENVKEWAEGRGTTHKGYADVHDLFTMVVMFSTKKISIHSESNIHKWKFMNWLCEQDLNYIYWEIIDTSQNANAFYACVCVWVCFSASVIKFAVCSVISIFNTKLLLSRLKWWVVIFFFAIFVCHIVVRAVELKRHARTHI